MMPPSPISRRKQADLAGSAGAGVLGAGLGALLLAAASPEVARPVAFGLLVVGMVLHGWGMLEKRRLEAGVAAPRWSTALYWLCWVALGILSVWAGLMVSVG